MAKDIELEEPEETPKRGRPKKNVEDVIFGDNIDVDEEKRLREEAEISRILDREDAAESTIIVARRPNRTQRYAHLAEIGIKDYNREEIARQYGGGEYRCRIRRSDGQFGATWYFSVDASRKPEVDPESVGGTPSGVDAVRLVETVAAKLADKQPTGPDMNSMLTMMTNRSDDMFKMMMAMQQENTKLLATILQSRPPETNAGLGQMANTLLQHSLQQSGSKLEDVLSTMTKLKRLTEDSRDYDDEPKEKGGSFIQDIMFAIPQVLKSLQQPAQPQPLTDTQVVTPMPVPMAPIPVPQAAQPQTPEPLPLPKGVDPQAFGMVVMNLVAFAKADSDPADVHNSYEPMLTDEMYDGISEFLEKEPRWFETISAVAPDAAPFRKWFDELRDIILEEEEVEVEAEHEEAARKVIEEVTQGDTSNLIKPKSKKAKS